MPWMRLWSLLSRAPYGQRTHGSLERKCLRDAKTGLRRQRRPPADSGMASPTPAAPSVDVEDDRRCPPASHALGGCPAVGYAWRRWEPSAWTSAQPGAPRCGGAARLFPAAAAGEACAGAPSQERFSAKSAAPWARRGKRPQLENMLFTSVRTHAREHTDVRTHARMHEHLLA